MLVLDRGLLLMVPDAFCSALGMLAYVGLGPGQEFIPYFLALLVGAGTVCLAILQWPFLALRRRLRGQRAEGPKIEPVTANIPEPPDTGAHDTP
jgi:hypothetical protein